MKTEIKNIKASVRARLQNKARESNRPFAEILQHYGMERFLYRLSQSEYADKFILKGALMFTVWQVPERRTTLDIDFLARCGNEPAVIERMIKKICKTKVVADGLIFDPDTVVGQKIKEGADYERVRIRFRGFLERARISMQVDIGFGDVIYPRPPTIDYPALLDFPKPHLKGYTLESVIAEKVEAIVKLGSINSRMKDFYDLWLMMRQFDINGSNLVEAIKRTFRHRNAALPRKAPLFAEEFHNDKSDRQTLWRAFMARSAVQHAPEKLSAVAKSIEQFLTEPLKAIAEESDFQRVWKAAGSWA